VYRPATGNGINHRPEPLKLNGLVVFPFLCGYGVGPVTVSYNCGNQYVVCCASPSLDRNFGTSGNTSIFIQGFTV